MPEPSTDHFYTSLPVQDIRISKLFGSSDAFTDIPEDWHIVITDVRNSTEVIRKGEHQHVNLIATGCIIAALNLAKKSKLTIPFFFGGDGATLIIPNKILFELMEALSEHRKNALKTFNLDLRLGSVSLHELYDDGHNLRIAKAMVSDKLITPIVLGTGLSFAESKIKDPDFVSYQGSDKNSFLDLSGMECRWDKLKPPTNSAEVLSLLVDVAEGQEQAPVFEELIEIIDSMYGSPQTRKPFSVFDMKLEASVNRIYDEMKVRIRRFSILYLSFNLLATWLGKIYLRYTKPGKAYLKELIDLTDTLIVDGRLNTVISSTPKQRQELEEKLNQLEKEGKIFFGLHISTESIMSCYVKRADNEHLHFVDGAGGGYTQAAKMLKAKLREH